MDPTEMYNAQATRLAKQMKLDDEKSNLFKVLYLDYMTARANAVNPKGEKDSQENTDFSKLTDQQATELIDKQFKNTEAQLNVDKQYCTKFLEILTPSQTARIFLRQARMRAAMEGQNGGNRRGFNGRPGGQFGGGQGQFGGGQGQFGGGPED